MNGAAVSLPGSPSSDGQQSDSEEAPLSAPPLPCPTWWPAVEFDDPNLQHAATGAACALQRLMLHWYEPRPAPRLLDESILPLRARGAVLTSFNWGGDPIAQLGIGVPPLVAVSTALFPFTRSDIYASCGDVYILVSTVAGARAGLGFGATSAHEGAGLGTICDAVRGMHTS